MNELQNYANQLSKLQSETYNYRKKVTDLEQQLAEREKQNVLLRGFVKLLRDYIPASAIGNMTVQDALDATADLSGLILCDAEPLGYADPLAFYLVQTSPNNDRVAVRKIPVKDDIPLYKARKP